MRKRTGKRLQSAELRRFSNRPHEFYVGIRENIAGIREKYYRDQSSTAHGSRQAAHRSGQALQRSGKAEQRRSQSGEGAARRTLTAGFMPLLEENTEFAAKWSSLYSAQLSEGFTDPIKKKGTKDSSGSLIIPQAPC